MMTRYFPRYVILTDRQYEAVVEYFRNKGPKPEGISDDDLDFIRSTVWETQQPVPFVRTGSDSSLNINPTATYCGISCPEEETPYNNDHNT